MDSAPGAASDPDLPDISQSAARRLVVSLGLFWGSFPIAVPALPNAVGLTAFLVGFAAGMVFFATLLGIWNEPLFKWPGRGYLSSAWRQNKVMFSLFRPAFIRRVFAATGWPPWLVGGSLLALLAAGVTAVAVFSPPG